MRHASRYANGTSRPSTSAPEPGPTAHPAPVLPQAQALSALFDKYVPRLLSWLRINAKPVMFNEAVCHVNTLLTLLKSSLQK